MERISWLDAEEHVLREKERLADIVKVIDGEIIIEVKKGVVRDCYFVSLVECNSYENILRQVCHLTTKGWITRDVLREFIAVASRENNIKLPI